MQRARGRHVEQPSVKLRRGICLVVRPHDQRGLEFHAFGQVHRQDKDAARVTVRRNRRRLEGAELMRLQFLGKRGTVGGCFDDDRDVLVALVSEAVDRLDQFWGQRFRLR